MKITYENNNIILKDVCAFNLTHIFECGQCFRWNLQEDGAYIGVAGNKVLRISQNGSTVVLHNTTRSDFENFWYDYFDFSTDYTKVKKELSKDEVLKNAIPFGSGIRILKQDLWETVISFIISASNNIPRIKKIIELLCENFGTEIEYDGGSYYSFPSPEKIASLTIQDLAVIRAGFRDKYILAAASKFVSGEISNDMFCNFNTKDSKKVLMSMYGVGSKVADCILLFGLSKKDAFPVDVWVKRIMETLYFKQETKNSVIEDFALEHFGEFAGLAQQYLFFYARENLH